jgi:hypothetical protein
MLLIGVLLVAVNLSARSKTQVSRLSKPRQSEFAR